MTETRFGLSQKIIALLIKVFSSYHQIDKVVIFGSRAKGTFHPGSDIDLAVFSNQLTYDEFQKLRLDIENLSLLYKVDILDYNKIDNQNLLGHINRVGKVFYQPA